MRWQSVHIVPNFELLRSFVPVPSGDSTMAIAFPNPVPRGDSTSTSQNFSCCLLVGWLVGFVALLLVDFLFSLCCYSTCTTSDFVLWCCVVYLFENWSARRCEEEHHDLS